MKDFQLSTKQLRAIVSVARYRSFVAASAELGLSQPAISRLVSEAERQLGAALFVRNTRNVAVTAAGREFLPAVERLLQDLSMQVENARSLGGQQRGRLLISCLLSVTHHVLPQAVVQYRKRHPNIEVQIRERLGIEVHEDVRGGLADFGIGNVIGTHESVVVDDVVQESCYLLLPRNHPLARRKSVSLKAISQQPMVSMPTDAGLRRQIDTIAAANGMLLNHMTIAEQYGSIFDFVASGLGLSIIPASALPPKRDSRLAVRPLTSPPISRKIGILRLKERPISPAAAGFLEVFRPLFMSAIRR
jgi:LysR family carnitine catabolism transcriptional activator